MKTIALLLLVACAGCTTRTLTLPGGGSYVSKRFGNKEGINEVVVVMPDGTRFEMRGYISDQVSAIAAAAEGAARGAVKGVAPTP